MNYAMYIFKLFLNNVYFEHLASYFLFFRILTLKKITDDDIKYSQYLIEDFIKQYEFLFGKNNLTYNLHCHLHLPLQVLLYGPFHIISCFPFEGFFKICHGLYFGTSRTNFEKHEDKGKDKLYKNFYKEQYCVDRKNTTKCKRKY